jgi:hypothetical protein
MNTTTNDTTKTNATPVSKPYVRVEYTGALFKELTMFESMFRNLFSLTEEQANKLVIQAAKDFKHLCGSVDAETGMKVGAISKTGVGSLVETTKTKASLTKALQCIHALQWADTAGKHGVSRGNTGWELAAELQEFALGL